MLGDTVRGLISSTRHMGHVFAGHCRRFRRYLHGSWPGADPCRHSSSHAIYVHYDAEGVVHDYVLEQLRQLSIAGFRVTFVSNARKFRDASVAAVKPFCRQIIRRRNVGYDFGAYKDAIALLGDLAECDRLLLMNDSVYGPFRPLTSIFEMADPECDFWGITDSWHQHHVGPWIIGNIEIPIDA